MKYAPWTIGIFPEKGNGLRVRLKIRYFDD
jgi:hypothetical protein